MNTAQDIRIHAQLHIGMPMEPSYAVRYLNECILRLVTEFDSCKKLDILNKTGLVKGTHNEILDVLAIKQIFKDDRPYFHYTFDHNILTVEHDGDYRIETYSMPTFVDVETDIPDVPKAFYPSLAVFLASRERSRLFSDEDTDTLRLFKEFMDLSSAANLLMSRQKRKRGRIRSREW